MRTGKGKVLCNTPHRENARRVVERLQGARGMGHIGLTGEGIFTAGSIAHSVS